MAPYFPLMTVDAPSGSIVCVKSSLGCPGSYGRAPWRMTPNDLPPWEAVYEQTQRWLSAEVFEAIGGDLRMLWRLAEGHIPRRSFSKVGSCNPAPKVAPARDPMGPNATGGATGIWPSVF
jgi:hypothetical protein